MTEQNVQPLIDATIQYVKKELAQAEGGHDWFHIERVYRNAQYLLRYEKANAPVVLLGALLHDIADSKFHSGDESIGPRKAAQFLDGLGVDAALRDHVVAIVKNVSFKGGNAPVTFHSKELEIVQDADRLDALGAIGIARTFNYGGYKNRALYNPEIAPKMGMTPAEYKASTAPTINHFYEKLLLLKDRMHTETGKKLAQQRHEFMEQFLEQFYAEWDGER
jgi:uncharacterized protein